jgi:hypothetical protein
VVFLVTLMTTIAEHRSFMSRETVAAGLLQGLTGLPLTPAGGSKPVAAAANEVTADVNPRW